jgi:hypothetical protein
MFFISWFWWLGLFWWVQQNRSRAHVPTNTNNSIPTDSYSKDKISSWILLVHYLSLNPGYPGRTEVPKNWKSLPIIMMVPDFAFIAGAEISLFSYGFSNPKKTCSKNSHYLSHGTQITVFCSPVSKFFQSNLLHFFVLEV